jgi:hypothetical protein
MSAQVAKAVATLLAFISSASDPTDGMLTFWGDKNFKGEMYQFHRSLEPQYCYNDNVGQPSSITWANQIQTGSFDGKAKIAFYTEPDCKGICLAWFTTVKDFPRDLALDQIDNKIKSFMLWQTKRDPDVIVRDVD